MVPLPPRSTRTDTLFPDTTLCRSVRAALRIVAAESKTMQQAHSALRADLSAALIRLQSDINANGGRADGKLAKLIADVNSMTIQRRLTTSVLEAVLLSFGVTLCLLAGGVWFLITSARQSCTPVPLETPNKTGKAPC